MIPIRRILMTKQLLFIAVIALTGCSTDTTQVSRPPETLHNVPVFTAQNSTVPDQFEAVGTVRAAQASQLAAQMMGTLVEIRVHEGDRVQRGQVLAVIDDAQPRSALERAVSALTAAQQEVAASESDYTLADSTHKRYQTLFDRKSVSPQEFDEIKARRQAALARRDMSVAGEAQAEAALSQARTSLGYSRIRAPFDGVVTEKKADLGALASPGLPIFTLEDTQRYRLEAPVDESNLRLVRLGQSLPVTVDALNAEPLPGKVSNIAPAADPSSRSFLVKVDLPADQRLRSGFFGRVRIARGERTALLVPRTAVVDRGQLQAVYILDTNRIANLRYVTLGKAVAQQVEILSGLESGEVLVTAPGDLELAGKRIEAQ